jgi:hypothetical protein
MWRHASQDFDTSKESLPRAHRVKRAAVALGTTGSRGLYRGRLYPSQGSLTENLASAHPDKLGPHSSILMCATNSGICFWIDLYRLPRSVIFRRLNQIAQSTGLSIVGKRLTMTRCCAAAALVMMTRIGVIKALNRNVEGIFNPDAKKNYREQAQAQRRSVSHGVKLGNYSRQTESIARLPEGPNVRQGRSPRGQPMGGWRPQLWQPV